MFRTKAKPGPGQLAGPEDVASIEQRTLATQNPHDANQLAGLSVDRITCAICITLKFSFALQAQTQEAQATRKKYTLQQQAGKSRYEIGEGQQLAVSRPMCPVKRDVQPAGLQGLSIPRLHADTDSWCTSTL